jgi:perosamine synthetase
VLIEDAAESLGSSYRGRHTGNVGRVSALSFNGNKVVTTGGGGAVLTNDATLGRRAKHLTTTARTPHRWNFLHDEVGYNYRLPNLNAALGCAQLERLPSMVDRKRRLAARYDAAFSAVEGVSFLREPAGTSSNYWLNAIVLDARQEAQRDDLLAALNDANFMSRPVWTLMHKLPMYAACPRSDLTLAEQMQARVINLPSSPKLAD